MGRFVEMFKGRTASEKKQHTANILEAASFNIDDKASLPKFDLTKESLRDICRATLGDEAYFKLQESRVIASKVLESVDPVDSSAFTNITQLLVLQGSIEGYRHPEFIGNQLVTVNPSPDDNVMIPGLSEVDDQAVEIAEGEEYQDTKFGEDYITTPRSVKKGRKIGLTKEMIFFDRTGQAVKRAQQVGYLVGRNKEIRILAEVLGLTNSFKRNGVARNTYVATGTGDPRINKLAANPLVNYASFDTAWQVFQDMSNDNTKGEMGSAGEPIFVNPETLLIPQALSFTAERICRPGFNGMVRQTDSTIATYSDNPMQGAGVMPKNIVTSPWIHRILTNAAYGNIGSSTAKGYWYWGDFKRAFGYREVFPYEMIAAPAGNMDDWERDVVVGFKARERGTPFVVAPWNVAQFLPS